MLGRGHGEKDLCTDIGSGHVCRRKAEGLSEVHDLGCPEVDAVNARAWQLPAARFDLRKPMETQFLRRKYAWNSTRNLPVGLSE